MALSLYRKYRPNVFADVVGQEHVIRTLVNAISENSIAHAYLFCGPRGTGKTTTARLLAKALLCENGAGHEPDGTCEQCQAIANGSHPDVYELDAASRTGVDNVREEIISRVNFAPTRGRAKIYIIDEVHMLSIPAFNALLKTLEEPPANVVFVLCTTDPQKVPETIQSRCQRFDFRRFSLDEIVSYLERICTGEGFEYQREALEVIAAKSSGGMRDATTALEQAAVFADGALISVEAVNNLFGQTNSDALFELTDAIAARDAAGCFIWLDNYIGTGADLERLAHQLAQHFRDLYVTALTDGANGIVACTPSELPRYQQQAQLFGPERLSRALDLCGELMGKLRYSQDKRLVTEIALTRLVRPESDLTLESLAERVENLERNGVAAAPTQAARSERPQQEAQPQPVQQLQPEPARSAQPEPQHQPQPVQHQQTELQPVRQPEPQPDRMPQPEPTRQSRAESQPAQEQQPQSQPTAARQQQSQQAEPQPTPSHTGAVQDNISLPRLQAAVFTEVKREDVATAALLSGVEFERDGEGYCLEFPPEAKFAMGIASKGAANKLLTTAFAHVLGHRVQISYRLAKGKTQTSSYGGGYDSYGSGSSDSYGSSEGSVAPEDDGYFNALASSASYYDESPAQQWDGPSASVPSQASQGGSFASSASSSPDFGAPTSQPKVRPAGDDESAANIADILSAFGSGVKLQEIDPTDQ